MPFISNIGPLELLIVLAIALLVLGPGKLPEVGAALGRTIREFRKASTDLNDPMDVNTASRTPAMPAVQSGSNSRSSSPEASESPNAGS